MVEIGPIAPPSVDIRVELFGSARLLVGKRHVDIAVPEQADISDIVATLSGICPELVGDVIHDDRSQLQPSHTFNLNGTTFLTDDGVELHEGDTLLMFSSQAGG